ncbi:MAG: Phosphotransferase [Betaproteobacteria bacterium]|nr:Phosphotransferase [Betaproteobacteria bacterium]
MKTASFQPNSAAPAPANNTPDPALGALLPAYFERRAADARLLAAALAEHDYAQIAAIGHRLKGLGSTYGHDAISEAGRDFEAAAAVRDGPRVQSLLEGYIQLLAELH